MTWSPAQYAKFEAERNRPIGDLLMHVPVAAPTTAIDLGCGPGNSTQYLVERYPEAMVSGLDSSPQMIAAARQRLPAVDFQLGDIAAWPDPGPYDVILANASLQWVSGHETLLPALMAKVAPGGALAVQVPDNHDEPAHRLMRQVAAEAPFGETLLPILAKRAARKDVDWYYRLLSQHAASIDVWVTIYHHRLPGGVDDLIEWFRGTGLRRYLDPLPETQKPAYLERYREVLADAYPVSSDGAVLLPFPRLFFIAVRGTPPPPSAADAGVGRLAGGRLAARRAAAASRL